MDSDSTPSLPHICRYRDACPEAMASIIEGHQSNLATMEAALRAAENDSDEEAIERLRYEIACSKALIRHSESMIRDELPKGFPAVWRSDYRPVDMSLPAIGQWLEWMSRCFDAWARSNNSVLRERGKEEEEATDCGENVEDAQSLMGYLADKGHPEYVPRPDSGRKWTPRRASEEFRRMRRYVIELKDDRPPSPSESRSPKQYLKNWSEILDALGLKNTEESRRLINRYRKAYDDCPIIIAKQGSSPRVDKAKLIEWWNSLESRWKHHENASKGEKFDAESQHSYGHEGAVIPAIRGSVKRRRKDFKG